MALKIKPTATAGEAKWIDRNMLFRLRTLAHANLLENLTGFRLCAGKVEP